MIRLSMTKRREKPAPTPCLSCGTIFQPIRKGNTLCSRRCQANFWTENNREKHNERMRIFQRAKYNYRPAPTEPIECKRCASTFVPETSWQKYCCHGCAEKGRYYDNPEKAKAKSIRVRMTHAEQYRARDRQAWTEMRETRGLEGAVYAKARCPWLPLLTGARHRCLNKNLPFDLTTEWCDVRWTGRCELTDLEFDLRNTGRSVFSPSIDRIEPRKGYVQDNCRFILFGVNLFKFTSSDEDMFRIAKALVKHSG